jgi:hypothetical protein
MYKYIYEELVMYKYIYEELVMYKYIYEELVMYKYIYDKTSDMDLPTTLVSFKFISLIFIFCEGGSLCSDLQCYPPIHKKRCDK